MLIKHGKVGNNLYYTIFENALNYTMYKSPFAYYLGDYIDDNVEDPILSINVDDENLYILSSENLLSLLSLKINCEFIKMTKEEANNCFNNHLKLRIFVKRIYR